MDASFFRWAQLLPSFFIFAKLPLQFPSLTLSRQESARMGTGFPPDAAFGKTPRQQHL